MIKKLQSDLNFWLLY